MKKQDLVKLAILGMMGIGTTMGAQQSAPQNPQTPTDYDGSKGICTDKVSNYSSSDTSGNAGKPVPKGQMPSEDQSQKASSKTWGGSKSNLAGCSGSGGCSGSYKENCSGTGGCKQSTGYSESCGAGTCAGSDGDDYKGNSANMSSKRKSLK